ncbi:MAG: NADH:ubiquinone oxidoreductase [Chloroflexi bacterium RBG_13_66_10]|nr:MAG: NADH:ubiquinone oxidoreductase [Chloroflexi bacterium RBG_13_66_10]
MARPKVAFFEFTSCEGCQLTVVDSLQTAPELLEAVEIVRFREAMSERGEGYAVAFVEGACSRPGDEAALKEIREKAQLVVALGACAHLGGINTIRNRHELADVRQAVYGDKADWYDTYPARPIEAVIPVDAFLPGCPIDRHEFIRAVKALLQGRAPQIPDQPVCVECKLKENVCVYLRGRTCLGPVVRAGCDAICPTYGDGCEGCRGLIPSPNLDSLKQVLAEHHLSPDETLAKLTLFLTYQTMAMEAAGDGTAKR